MGVHLSQTTPRDPSGPTNIVGEILEGSGGLGSALGQGVSGLIEGIGSAIGGVFAPGGLFAPIGDAVKDIRDGQLDLEDRADLLSPLLDYGTCFFPNTSSMTGNGRVPMVQQLGPARGLELLTDSGGGFRFLDVGLWNIDVQVTADSSWGETLVGSGKFQVTVQVYRPDGTVFSQQSGYISNINPVTITVVSSVVVEEPGCYVKVVISQMHSQRKVLAGPRWSRMTVQHISRQVDGPWATGSESSENTSD